LTVVPEKLSVAISEIEPENQPVNYGLPSEGVTRRSEVLAG